MFGRNKESKSVEESGETRSGFFGRLRERLSKTKDQFVARMRSAIRLRGKIDEDLLEELEEILIQSDVGPETAVKLTGALRKRSDARGDAGAEELIRLLKEEIRDILGREKQPIVLDAKPTVVLIIGVNGSGKTTTIGKMAERLRREGKSVMLVAADTFRAAAVDQLQIWADRTGAMIVKQGAGADPSAVCFDAMQAAKARAVDVVLIDTAGRLHTKTNLMEELKKINRVIKKHDPDWPHETLLVLDATTGQNALNQARMFNEAIPITGLAMTKLDGTAKGGVLIALRDRFPIPVRMIGVGESAEDYQEFDPGEFVDALFEE